MKRILTAAAIVLAAAATTAGGAEGGQPAGSSCTLEVGAPFLYVDIVFAPATVSCSSSQNRITVTTVLTRDGTEAARNTRQCTHMAVCHNDVGSWVTDVAGDQVWCTTATASVHGTTFAPQTRCENEAF